MRHVYGTLSEPPPCIVCKSTEHGHIDMGNCEYACPAGMDLSPHKPDVPRTDEEK